MASGKKVGEFSLKSITATREALHRWVWGSELVKWS